MKKVVAIDGPSGAGKSTIARLAARDLGFEYLDTGALYRASALYLVSQGLKEDSTDEDITRALQKAAIEFRDGRVLVNGSDVSDEIRTPQAGHYASVFSARIPVREHLLDIQREAAGHSDLVAEGRDMTTIVFPAAFKKIYLDASVEERARRRTLELKSKGFDLDDDRVRAEIIERDARDSGRDIAPLMKAPDAVCIDTTGLSIDEVLGRILDVVRG